MIHFGKEPSGTLRIEADGDDVRQLYQVILSAGLEQRRVFHGLKTLIEDEYKDILLRKEAAHAVL